MATRRYPNLVGVFVKAFPIVTDRIGGQDRRETVTWHGRRYTLIGDPTGHVIRQYAFDVIDDDEERREAADPPSTHEQEQRP